MYSIENMPNVIEIGYAGEKNFRKVEIDMTAWMEEMPNGVPSIVAVSPGASEDEAYIAGTTFEDNILTWTLTDGDTGLKEGTGSIQIWLEEQDTYYGTINKRGKSVIVATRVEPSLTDPDAVAPAAQQTWIDQMTAMKVATVNAAAAAEDAKTDAETAQGKAEDAQEAAEEAQEAAETAQEAAEEAQEAAEEYKSDSEAWARGTRDGVEVESTDPAYHDNSKYWKEQADASATAAAGHKEDSEAYAVGKRNGVDVGSSDPTYHNNSKYWSDSAWEAAQHASSDVIDDTSGAGTTDKTWSADKIVTEFGGKADLVNGVVPVNQLQEATQSVSGLMTAADKTKLDGIIDTIYPVGSIYMSVASTSPAALFGGTWERLKSRFLLGAEDAGDTTSDPYVGGATGGAASVSYTPFGTVDGHTLTTDEIPSHDHGLNGHTHSYTYPTGSTQGNSGNTSSTTIDFSNGYAGVHATGTGYVETREKSTGNMAASNEVKGTSSSAPGSYTSWAGLYGSQAHTHTHNGHTHTVNTGTTTTQGNSDNTTAKGGGGSHNHGFTGTQATISTMPPFLSVYMWKRTA